MPTIFIASARTSWYLFLGSLFMFKDHMQNMEEWLVLLDRNPWD